MLKRTKLCTSLMIAFGSGIAVPANGATNVGAGGNHRLVDPALLTPRRRCRHRDQGRRPDQAGRHERRAGDAADRLRTSRTSARAHRSAPPPARKAEADLRGLGGPTGANGNKTLVLLNGRRIVNHSFERAAVDLNAIPLNAIDRIEVLRDGASAIYGTDAIGGVINFILKRDYQGFEMSAQTQQPQHYGRRPDLAAQRHRRLGLAGDERLQLMGSFDYRNQHVLEAAQRSFSKTGVIRGDVTCRHQRHQLPGRPERLRADAADLQPAGDRSPTGRHRLPLRLLARRRHHSAEPAGTTLVKGSFAITPDHIGSIEYLLRKNLRPRASPRRRPAPDAGEQPVLPRRRAHRRSAAFPI
jgi:iron complex outermembrane receptor protein